MTAVLFSLFLVSSSYEVKWPDPYVGFGMALTRVNETQPDKSYNHYRRKFLNMALPFKVLKVGETDSYLPHYVVLPELAWYNDLIQVNLAGGFEGGWPLGYRSAVSMVWGTQAGFHYSLIRLPNYLNEYGKVMDSADKTSAALLLNFYTGPKWELNDKYAMRFLINPKVMLGKVAFNSVRSEFFRYMGLTISFNLQFEFL